MLIRLRRIGPLAALCVAALLSACSVMPTPAERRSLADTLANGKGWEASIVVAGDFHLLAYAPARVRPSDTLTVYIEGDGFAWASPLRPSDDPTPRNPVALRLALAHPETNAAYLARPCQYVGADQVACPRRYWTDARFAPEVVDAASLALDVLKARSGAQQLVLVGYSGGGAIAALVAARRPDVERLITVAGNLDHLAWTRHHGLQPLAGSMNPADQADQLRNIPQWHLVGEKDKVIPPALAQGFAERFPSGHQPRVIVEANFDHQCCWAENWQRLFSEVTSP